VEENEVQEESEVDEILDEMDNLIDESVADDSDMERSES
jgi:hypothetical protein